MSVSSHHICLNGTRMLVHCYSLYSPELDYEIENKSNNFKYLVGGEDFICFSSANKISCDGNLLLELVDNDILYIYKLKAGNHNICAFYSQNLNGSSGHIKFHCWGSEDTLINNIDERVYNFVYRTDLLLSSTIADYAIGKNTACLMYTDNYKEFSSCWGTCNDNLCEIPEYNRQMVLSVDVGWDHACTINEMKHKSLTNVNGLYGKASCWGSDGYGQLAISERYKEYSMKVYAYNQTTCIFTYQFILNCVGRIHIYDFNLSSFSGEFLKPYNLNIEKSFSKITLGGKHSCGVKGGTYSCWGSNEYGQTDLPSYHWSVNWEISTGWDFTCLHGFDRSISCIGFNLRGQTDIPDDVNEDSFEYTQISTGLAHTCFIGKKKVIEYYTIREEDMGVNMPIISCWGGNNEFGELNFTQIYSSIDEEKLKETQPNIVSVGDFFTCIQSEYNYSEYRITCFGNNDFGQCEVPEAISAQTRLVYKITDTLTSCGAHSCALIQTEKSVWCWGSDQFGESSVPQSLLGEALYVSAGDIYTCAIEMVNRAVECWGIYVVQYLKDRKYDWVVAGFGYFCVKERFGDKVGCFGDDEYGQSTLVEEIGHRDD